MQIQNFDNTHNHSMHQVTNCLHDHSVSSTKTGGMGMKASPHATQTNPAEKVMQSNLSLSDIVKNLVFGGRKLIFTIWGDTSGVDTSVAVKGENTSFTREQVLAQIDENNIGQQAATVQSSLQNPKVIESNPYFAAVEDTGRAGQSIREKIRVRFHQLTGQLSGRFSAKQFSAKNSTHTNQRRSREDLRKHSRYRKDGVEIDCVLTDDSYLMDSYDRKGEYSTLSTKQ